MGKTIIQMLKENIVEIFFGLLGFYFIVVGYVTNDWKMQGNGFICLFVILAFNIGQIKSKIGGV